MGINIMKRSNILETKWAITIIRSPNPSHKRNKQAWIIILWTNSQIQYI